MVTSVHKRKTYAMAVGTVAPVVIERDNRFWLPDEPILRPACAWNDAGKLIGSRYYGPMCGVNPLKTSAIKFISPDVPEPEPVIVATAELLPVIVTPVDAPAGSCILL